MVSTGDLTYIKTNGNKFKFTDKSAIKQIIFGNEDDGKNGVYTPDQNGKIHIKLKDYSIATGSSLGMVSIPEYLDDNITENGIKISSSGKITVKFPIKNVKDGNGNIIPVNNNSILQIPNVNEINYGLAKIGGDAYCVKAENGMLYIKFSEGWTDVCKEKEDISFTTMKNIGRLSLGEYEE